MGSTFLAVVLRQTQAIEETERQLGLARAAFGRRADDRRLPDQACRLNDRVTANIVMTATSAASTAKPGTANGRSTE
jgi:hypothetical protein